MKITKLTITGADNKTNQSDLVELSEKYPFIEWAILFSKTKAGEPRYPSPEYITQLVEETDIPLAAHFCGWWAKEVLENKNYDLIRYLPDNFQRVQLNYNFKNSVGYKLADLLVFALELLAEKPDMAIILQYNKSNAEELGKFVNHFSDVLPHNIHFLYDASGGRGTVIERIDVTIGRQYTGYAGGINPENIEKICQMIVDDMEPVNTWVDLETGARTDDEFDLDKVEDIAQKASKFIV